MSGLNQVQNLVATKIHENFRYKVQRLKLDLSCTKKNTVLDPTNYNIGLNEPTYIHL